MPREIAQQDTYDHIFGSSFNMYGWWGPIRPDWDQRYDAPHGWSVLVPVWDGKHRLRTVLVTHSVILAAMRKIAKGSAKYTTREVVQACQDFLHDPEDADFDANTADEVMQVATLGEVVYC
ncbi:hypothetical protein HKX69_05915 [Streptomyces argyrophyllae]|uniref:Uncharacterized protein n=1 Tax=Streptomyces argyrophylli TaxID=2726118 RepID=A0A6M4PF34_9ACTN|nr:hypothetical protein [Streptomyces argyrophyllae]QJS09109.1 hypothetical protein HKX69_05915 [Streptomyces argyrophyllae]